MPQSCRTRPPGCVTLYTLIFTCAVKHTWAHSIVGIATAPTPANLPSSSLASCPPPHPVDLTASDPISEGSATPSFGLFKGSLRALTSIRIGYIAELELALEIGAPEVVWRAAGRERRAGRPVPRPPRDLDQAVPVKHGVDRALGRNADVTVQSADQELADLAGTPMGLVALDRDDQALDLRRQLVGVANRPARAVGQGLETVFLVALADLVAGLARNADRATDLAHRFAV